ncbi:MAG: nucleotidyltransferase family protein, partial [Coriobacteriia bacterium]|nr:nucleotidyltransferase family protein [Coriobacteriia bacterium]
SSQPASVVAEVPTRCSACREGETPLATLAPGASSAAARLRRLLEAHRDEILRIASRRRACNVRVFGSVARGDARENSDVDLLVDLEPHASLFDLGGLNGELEELLGVKVDVVPVGSLKPHVRARALAEATPL